MNLSMFLALVGVFGLGIFLGDTLIFVRRYAVVKVVLWRLKRKQEKAYAQLGREQGLTNSLSYKGRPLLPTYFEDDPEDGDNGPVH